MPGPEMTSAPAPGSPNELVGSEPDWSEIWSEMVRTWPDAAPSVIDWLPMMKMPAPKLLPASPAFALGSALPPAPPKTLPPDRLPPSMMR